MGRYQAKKRQEAKKKETKPKAVEYTTAKGRGKNRVEAKPAKKVKRQSAIQAGADYRVMGITYDPKSGRPSDVPKNRQPVKAGSVKTPPTKTTPKATTTKTAPAEKKPASTSSKKLTPMQQWAKANPGLAKKVKKGQSGYKELKIGRSTKRRSWLDKNYKPGKK
jgi:hypothetical protein